MARRSTDMSRFEKIRQRLAQESFDSGGFWKPKVGTSKVRLLPEVGEMEFFFVNVGQHFISKGNQHYCPDFTLGEKCPICEFVNDLYTAGDQASIELARKIGVRKGFWMNVIDRANESAGPQIYTPGVMVFREIAAFAMNPQYGDLVIDENEGLDLEIVRTGAGLKTRYHCTFDRETSPLADDPAVIDQWLGAAIDLTPVLLTEDPAEDYNITHDEQGTITAKVAVEPYERLKEAFEGIDPTSLGSDANDDEDDEDEAEDKVSSVIRSRRGRRGRR